MFNIVNKWLLENTLKLNASKTKYMVIRSVRKKLLRDIIIKSEDAVIERVEKIKYLGVIIDSKLKFEDQCDYILKKVGEKISFLNRIGSGISAYTRCLVYKVIIAPHFEYCATLLACMNVTQLNRLQVAQNRAMRVILQCNQYTKIEVMLDALQFMSIRQRLCFNVCIFIFKLVNGMLPKQLCNKIQIIKDLGGAKTRQAENVRIEFRGTRNAQKSLFYEGIKMYNAIPTEAKKSTKLAVFKRLLRNYVSSTVR